MVPPVMIDLGGVEGSIGLDEAGRRARALYDKVREAEESLLQRRVKLGTLLLAIKRSMGHGGFGPFLERHCIHKHTAKSAMSLAGEFGGGPDGGLDTERMGEMRDAAVQAGRVPTGHRLETKDPEDWSAHEADIVVGRRPAERFTAGSNLHYTGVRPPDFIREEQEAARAAAENRAEAEKVAIATISEDVRDKQDRARVGHAGASGEQLGLEDHMASVAEELIAEAELLRGGGPSPSRLGEIAARLRVLAKAIEDMAPRNPTEH